MSSITSLADLKKAIQAAEHSMINPIMSGLISTKEAVTIIEFPSGKKAQVQIVITYDEDDWVL